MKQNKTGIISMIVNFFVLIILVLLVIQNYRIEKRLHIELETISENIDQNNEETITVLCKNNDLLLEEAQNINEKLNLLMEKSDVQFSKTVKMKQTYDELLDEQKKKTVDISAKDNSLIQTKKMADEYYEKKEYLQAYELYKKLLVYWNEDLEIRKNKLKSLFYSNRSDNSHYSEILEDIKILKTSQFMDDECEEIETIIKLEKEGLHE